MLPRPPLLALPARRPAPRSSWEEQGSDEEYTPGASGSYKRRRRAVGGGTSFGARLPAAPAPRPPAPLPAPRWPASGRGAAGPAGRGKPGLLSLLSALGEEEAVGDALLCSAAAAAAAAAAQEAGEAAAAAAAARGLHCR